MLYDQEHALSEEEETQAQSYRYARLFAPTVAPSKHNALHLNLSIASPPADDERHQNSAVCYFICILQ